MCPTTLQNIRTIERLLEIGEIDRADALLERSRRADPEHPGLLCLVSDWLLTTGDEAELSALASQQQRSLAKHHFAPLGFRHGRTLEALGRYDEAFAAWQRANQAMHRTWDTTTHNRRLAAIRDVYPPKRRLEVSSRTERPLFLVGMPRSGSTLLAQILARHPQTHPVGEYPGMHASAMGLVRMSGDIRSGLLWLNRPTLDHGASQYLRPWPTVSGIIVDKMLYNYEIIGYALQVFPRAQVLWCRRDSLDTCLSCYATRFDGHLADFSYDLTTLGHTYRAHQTHMEHWVSVFGERVTPVDYAHLVSQPETRIPELLRTVGLSEHADCLTPHLQQRPIDSQSSRQVRQPLHTESIGRAIHFAAHLAPLRLALDTSSRSGATPRR